MALISGPRLSYRCANGDWREVDLDTATRTTIGRSSKADVVLDFDNSVSRIHAVLERVGGHWTVADDGLSRNGTFLNGNRITGRRRLSTGDSVRLGNTLLIYREDTPPPEDPTIRCDGLPSRADLTDMQSRVLTSLCRPCRSGFASPASNAEIGEELYIGVETVRTHLRALFDKFGVEDLPNNQKRMRLVQRAMLAGIVRA